MQHHGWRSLALAQAGLVTRQQLFARGVSRAHIRAQLSAERWAQVAPAVYATFTGELTRTQMMWGAVLNGGADARLGGLTVAELAGLRGWDRPEVAVWVPYGGGPITPMQNVDYIRTRKPMAAIQLVDGSIARLRLEPALLLWAAKQRSERTALGVLTASVQQGLTTAESISAWHRKLGKIRHAQAIREAIVDMVGGAQSVAEIDVRKLCRRESLALPRRQVRRRDAHGRLRFTDAEWVTIDGRVVILEVDGAFHMDADHWEDDLQRQRALTDARRVVVRATARELREGGVRLAADLRRLGVASIRDARRLS